MPQRPLIGISADVGEPRPGAVRMECALAYSRAVARAGGMPIVLPPIVELIPEQLTLCRGFVLTGGDDPRTEMFGTPTHAAAKPLHETRQAYEVALLRALEVHSDKPTLGVCLGMQLMALCAGGELNQHMPDDVPTAAAHAGYARHPVRPAARDGVLAKLIESAGMNEVTSHHRQAVRSPGRLRTCVVAHDGVIEGIDDPSRRFYIGVQWHPERTDADTLGDAIFRALVEAARG